MLQFKNVLVQMIFLLVECINQLPFFNALHFNFLYLFSHFLLFLLGLQHLDIQLLISVDQLNDLPIQFPTPILFALQKLSNILVLLLRPFLLPDKMLDLPLESKNVLLAFPDFLQKQLPLLHQHLILASNNLPLTITIATDDPIQLPHLLCQKTAPH